jgi:hypothetical protein
VSRSRRRSPGLGLAALLFGSALLVASPAAGQTDGTTTTTTTTGLPGAPLGSTPTSTATILPGGKASIPADAPYPVVRAIQAANRIHRRTYVWGGGHRGFKSKGYDCSGAVSYVLGPKGAGLIDSPMPSGSFTNWGSQGKGKWITTYANSGHMFVVIAGLRFDTSQPDDGRSGPGWSKDISKGFANVSRNAARHKGRL